MRPTHLFDVALVFCMVSALGQAQLISNSAARSAKANAVNAAAADQFHTDLSAQREAQASVPSDDPANAQSQSRGHLITLLDLERTAPRYIPKSDLQSDTTCFFIRSYLMVRDDPHSDSTHRDGSTTCVPSARFRVYTANERIETGPSPLSKP
jgi:hypothetical protein